MLLKVLSNVELGEDLAAVQASGAGAALPDIDRRNGGTVPVAEIEHMRASRLP